MIVFSTALILIIAAVVARAGVATSSGTIPSLGPLRAIWSSAEQSVRRKLFLCGIVLRIAGLLGFSMLLGASTCWTAIASPTNHRAPGSVDIARPGRGVARCGTKQTS